MKATSVLLSLVSPSIKVEPLPIPFLSEASYPEDPIHLVLILSIIALIKHTTPFRDSSEASCSSKINL